MNVEKSVEEVKDDGVKIDRIVEKEGQVTSAASSLAESEAATVAAAMQADGQNVSQEQISLI